MKNVSGSFLYKPCQKTGKEAGRTGFFLAFFLPGSILLGVFALRGLSPFGPLSLNSMDGYAQYYPMLENMGRAWREGSPFYSFHGALGFNLWAQNAYYTNSPLWWVLYLLPQGWHIAAVDLLTALRLSLAGLTFYAWLQGTGREGVPAVAALALSTAYALGGYTVAFINQFMWADTVALLPLAVLGLERLMRGESPALYVWSLFLCLWSCFYTGYMVCLFLVLYFMMRTLEDGKRLRGGLRRFGRFAFYSLPGGGLAGVVLLPVYLALQQTVASAMGFENRLRWYHSLGEMLARFLPFGKIALAYEAPNLYCGLVSLCFACFFLVNRSVPLRRRFWRGALLLFLFASLNLNALDYVWHGFHYPNQLPGRESFLLIFLLLTTAADGIGAWRTAGQHGRRSALRKRERAGFALSLLLLLGVTLSAAYQLLTQTWVSSNESLRAQDAQMAEFIRLAGDDAKNDGVTFYRQEWSDPEKLNPGQQYGYAGVTWYSSTMPERAFDFFERLGLPVYAARVSTKYVQSEILNALFSVRYVLEDGVIQKNESALPLAFLTGEEALAFDMEASGARGEEGRRQLWEAVSGAPCGQLKERAAQLQAQGLRILEWKDTCIQGAVDCPQAGVLFTTLPDDGGWRIFVDGEETEVLTACGYLCAARIGQGRHEITFRYLPPGFLAGLLVSGLSSTVFLWIMIRKKAAKR